MREPPKWQTPVYDRTAEDVAAGADKCYMSAALLNRIESNTAYLGQLFRVEMDPRTWYSTDALPRAEMERILKDIQTVRDAYYALPGTPELPTEPSTLYSDINTMEYVQWSLWEMWRRNSQRQYTGEICAGQAIGVI